MTITDLKLMCINTIVLLLSFSNMEFILKIILLLLSIILTCMKIYTWISDKYINYKNKKNGNK